MKAINNLHGEIRERAELPYMAAIVARNNFASTDSFLIKPLTGVTRRMEQALM